MVLITKQRRYKVTIIISTCGLLFQWASTIRIQLSVEDGRFVLDKHTELESYSTGSLKQQSTGRYDDGRFVLDNTLSWIISTRVLLFQWDRTIRIQLKRVFLVQSDHHHIYLWTVASVSQHYKNPTDGRFVLDKHTELESYSTGSLKQQSTGRYDDGRFVLDKHTELDSNSASSLKQQRIQLSVLSSTQRPSSYLPLDCCFSEQVL
jgi:hypothetical protein